MDRRQFLHAGSAGALAALQSPLSSAQTAPADYKALVCIFLFGGNDGNNMIIPADTAGYNAYASVRTPQSGINITQASLLPFKTGSMTEPLGLNPVLDGLHGIAQAGKLAVLGNVGSLVRPITKAEYLAYKDRPDNLFSHSNQQDQWQSTIPDEATNVGWGGRLADAAVALNGSSAFPVITSVAGSPLFTIGAQQRPLAVSTVGGLGLSGFSSATAAVSARRAALDKVLALGGEHALIAEAGARSQQAIRLAGVVNPILTTTTSTVTSLFTTAGNSLAAQLIQVAKLIEGRASIGLKRQIFFVSLGGFDTHTNQLTAQGNQLTMVGNAMKSFYDATERLGVANNVTTFTLSDFGRTFKAAAGGQSGSDHAWGNHQLIMGGAVRGGLYGRMPVHQLGGPDDVSSEGRWLPTVSVDQYAATLATWFGISPAQLASVTPNIGKFPSSNLGFLG